eukprot:c26213_g1_i1 orf=203-1858(+)
MGIPLAMALLVRTPLPSLWRFDRFVSSFAVFSSCSNFCFPRGLVWRKCSGGGGWWISASKSERAVGMLAKPKDLYVIPFATSQTDMDQGIFFAQSGINRAVELRANTAWLSNAFSNSENLVVPVLGNKNLVKAGHPVFVSSLTFKVSVLKEDHLPCSPIFLGLKDAGNLPVFAVDVSSFCSACGDMPAWIGGGEWVDLRRYGPELQIADAGLLAYACGMVEWHSRNRFCGHCGGYTIVRDGGHSLQCSGQTCGKTSYPRLDPAVIMLVSCGDYVLLGRQSKWEPGRYSLPAGFVEIGETFEMAVAREVVEETGVKVNACSIRYAASQPWPFPSSLMVGFNAEAEHNSAIPLRHCIPLHQVIPAGNEAILEVENSSRLPEPSVDFNELEDARWIHREFLKASLLGKHLPYNMQFRVPGKYAIARILMQRWVNNRVEPVWAGNQIQPVEIDEGTFKYVLARVYDSCGNQRLVVRGTGSLAYHADIFKQMQIQLNELGLQVEVLGGGWIEHLSDQRTMHVYGLSQAYGQANHDVTATILRQWFPFHHVFLSWHG